MKRYGSPLSELGAGAPDASGDSRAGSLVWTGGLVLRVPARRTIGYPEGSVTMPGRSLASAAEAAARPASEPEGRGAARTEEGVTKEPVTREGGASGGSRRRAGKHRATFEIRTYGCQMNMHDSERLAGLLEEAGYRPAAAGITPDVVVFNTCAVRENADNRLYGNLGQLLPVKNAHPGMQIAVGGCLAQKDQALITTRAPWVDVVFG